MSFNPNDNNLQPISRTNYEEHFLLYADNELSPFETAAVEEFLKAHPDLKQELDLLLQTKLSIETIRLEDKDLLLAESMKLNSIGEELLLYIDNELDEKQKKAVEQKLKKETAFQAQYAELLKTKPGSPEKVVYPYKKELFRYEEKKPFAVYWMRIAAAAMVILSTGIFLFNYESKPDIVIAVGTKTTEPVKEIKNGGETKTEVAVATRSTEPAKPVVSKTIQSKDAPLIVRQIQKKPEQPLIKKPVILTAPEKEPEIIAKKKEQQVPEQNDIAVNKKTEAPSQQTLNNTTVTHPSVASLDNQTTTSAVTAVQTDMVKIDNEKKSSLKGILRKATRFIERRTNISTTDENDELLIGAVSLKL